MSDIAINALSRKRAELTGEIEVRAAALDQLRADLAHLDAAIRIMCPDAEPELIRPRKPSRRGCDWFGRQELPRLVLEGLRTAKQPLSCDELALTVMERKGLLVDAVALRRVAGMIKGALHRRDGGVVERVAVGRDVRSAPRNERVRLRPVGRPTTRRIERRLCCQVSETMADHREAGAGTTVA